MDVLVSAVTAPDPLYDPREALPAGLLPQRDNEAALMAAFVAGGGVPLSSAQAVAAAGPALAYPAGLSRCEWKGWHPPPVLSVPGAIVPGPTVTSPNGDSDFSPGDFGGGLLGGGVAL